MGIHRGLRVIVKLIIVIVAKNFTHKTYVVRFVAANLSRVLCRKSNEWIDQGTDRE